MSAAKTYEYADLKDAKNSAWIFRKSTNGGVYQYGQTVVQEAIPLPSAPQDGELGVKFVASCVIPSFRGRMDPEHFPKSNEYTPFTLNAPIVAELAYEVTESKAEGFEVGDWIYGFYPLKQLATVKADGSDSQFKMPPTKMDKKIPYQKYFSVMSLAGGLTPYYVWKYLEAGQLTDPASKTVLVTAASSTVGQVAGQLYKSSGCTVIGSTSTSAKRDKLMQLGGFDHVIAYKEEDFKTRLNELCPEGVDLIYENVGGTQLEAGVNNIKVGGTVVLCGLISDYNKTKENTWGLRSGLFDVVIKRLRIQGFLVLEIVPHLAQAIPDLVGMVMQGKVKTEETTIQGFQRWGEAMEMMLTSKAHGRLVISA